MDNIEEPVMGTINDNGMLIVEQVSPNISVTDSGFLLCSNCTISRTGVQEYTTREIPVRGDEDGNVKAFRSYTEVFRPESIASFENAPITIEHPPAMITPNNWKYHSVGVVSNVRQEGNLLKADLLITDANAIKQVQDNGLRYLSCGYNSRLVDNNDGSVDQTYIKGNHVAIVTSPRGGEICTIQDSTSKTLINTTKEPTMATKKKTMKTKIFQFMGLMDSEADKLVSALVEDDDEDNDITDSDNVTGSDDGSVSPVIDTPAENFDGDITDEDAGEARLQKIESTLAAIAEAVGVKLTDSDCDDKDQDVTDSDEDEDKEVNDSTDEDEDKDVTDSDEEDKEDGETPIADSYRTIISKAEIMYPGIKLDTPLRDSTIATNDGIDLKRQVLEKFYLTDSGRVSIDALTSGKLINKLDKDSINILFNSTVALKTQQNNMGIVRTVPLQDSKSIQNKIAELNKIHKELNHN